jgi:hypothetical protein
MPRVEFEPTITASERAKTVHVLDRSATVTSKSSDYTTSTTCSEMIIRNYLTGINCRGLISCIDPHFLDLDTSWRSVVSFTPRPLYPRGKSPRYPLDRRLGGPQSRSGRRGEEKILDPTGTRTMKPFC